MRVPALLLLITAPASGGEGFPLFNGRDTSGWHVSESNYHGNTKAWSVNKGVLEVTQDPPGNGGILLSNRSFRNFEITLEVRPDWGCDGGLFLRSTEKGAAYQVMLDYLEGGNIGGIYGEGLQMQSDTGNGDYRAARWQEVWKKNEWNKLRARIEGDIPHIQVWLNEVQIVDWTDSSNHLPGGATSGMIALQAHRSDPKARDSRWVPGGYHRFRNIMIKELPE